MKWLALVIGAVVALHAYAQEAEIDRSFGAELHRRCDSVVMYPRTFTVHRDDGSTILYPVYRSNASMQTGVVARLDANDELTTIHVEPEPAEGFGISNMVAHGPEHVVFAFTSADNNIRLVRLSDRGEVDTTFRADTVWRGVLANIAVDAEQRILLVGSFSTPSGYAMAIRLLPDGSFDERFILPISKRLYATTVVPLADGSFYLGGSFDTLRGSTARKLAHVLPDGTVDASFAPVVSDSEMVISMERVGTNDLLVFLIHQNRRRRLIRFGPDGTATASFPELRIDDRYISQLYREPDGRILAVGETLLPGSQEPMTLLAYVTDDGRLDTSQFEDIEIGNSITRISRDAAGRSYIGGLFTSVEGNDRRGYARLLPSWRLDTAFLPNCGMHIPVHEIEALPEDGSFVLGGPMIAVDERSTGPLFRLDRDGLLADDYRALFVRKGLRGRRRVMNLHIDDKGRAIFLEASSIRHGMQPGRARRMLPSGELDTTFRVDRRLDDSIMIITPLADGRIVICGVFTQVDGVQRNGIAMLDTNGRLDTSFDPGTGRDSSAFPIRSVVQASNGDLLVAGDRFRYDGGPASNIHRIALSGRPATYAASSLRLSAAVGKSTVTHLIPLPDGRCYAAGTFDIVNDRVFSNVIRLTAAGGLDINFTPSITTRVNAMQIDGHGRIYMAANQLVRLDSNGNQDEAVQVAFNAQVYDMALVDSTGLIVVGDFEQIAEVNVPFVAKIRLPEVPTSVIDPVQWARLSITPHPVHDRAVLSLPPDQGAVMVTVTDMCGREVLRREVTADAVALDADGWAPGLYAVRVAGRITMTAPLLVAR